MKNPVARTKAKSNAFKSPAEMDEEELGVLLRELAVSLRDARTIDDRRELVGKLLARKVRRSRIVSIITKAFGIVPRAVDEDIAWAKDWMLAAYKKKSVEDFKAELIGIMDEAMARGFTKDDLGSVVAAARHKAQLTGAIEEGTSVGINVNVAAKEAELRDKVRKKLARLSQPKG
jgi:hypothetical protein